MFLDASPTHRFRKNLRFFTRIKLGPEMWFSHRRVGFIRHVASYEYQQLHSHAMCISLLNVVAICFGNSSIQRRGNAHVPLNLYRFAIGKSGKNCPFECALIVCTVRLTYGK